MVPASAASAVSLALRQVEAARANLLVEQRRLLSAISDTIRQLLRTQFLEIRRELNLTQSEVSRLTGLPFTTLARWETGKAEPSLRLLNCFCTTLTGMHARSPSLDRLVEIVAALNAITIPRLREYLGLTHAVFARFAGVTRIMVVSWEEGKNEPRLRSLLTLCEHLDRRLAPRPGIDRQSRPHSPAASARRVPTRQH
jgi:DNA-binding transcriptional regulator YiaG